MQRMNYRGATQVPIYDAQPVYVYVMIGAVRHKTKENESERIFHSRCITSE